MSVTTTKFQEQRREIVFKGQLQQKITKRFGTLLRKKKAIYDDELWVLLCIHEGGISGIPHLEWYGDLRSAYEHNPLKVQDLLNCQYVNVAIGEERCMVIGFVDKNRPVLELSAPTVEERRQWVAKLTETLRRLKCPLNDENSQNDEEEDEIGPGTCCPRTQNEYVALDEIEDEFGGGTSPTAALSNMDQSPYVQLAAGNPSTSSGLKLSLADTIPMHSSTPSTSISPPKHQQFSFTTLPRTQGTPKLMASLASKPICIRVQKSTHPQQISPPGGSNIQQQQQMDERREIKEENEIEEETKKGESDVPPPLPPRKSLNQNAQQQQPILSSSCSPTPPILPSSPIPCSPPPRTCLATSTSAATTILNCSSNAENENNNQYRSLESEYHTLEPTIRKPNSHNQNQFLAEYDKLNSSTPTAGHYQQLSRLSGNFSQPLSSAGDFRFSNSSSGNATTNSDTSFASPNSSQRNSGTGIVTYLGEQQRPKQISSPRNSSGSDPQQQYDILPSTHSPSPLPMPQMNFAEQIFNESLARPRRVSLSLSLLAEHIAFVDAGGKVWVAGWSPKADTNLRNILHFGDEVERMAGIELRTVKQLPEIYAQTKPGVQIELGLRANPRAKVYTLQRTANPKKEFGIVLHKRKNKIASIEPRSPADNANLPARLPPFFYNKMATEMPSVITELDGIPLSLFARNEQFFHRIELIPLNGAINLTLHPSDFCSCIATQMKAQIRVYRRFIHDQ